MTASEISALLAPYIVGLDLPPAIFQQLRAYLDLLLRWNAKTNLTAIRDPENIVTRHFGESLFAAGVLFGSGRDSIPGTPSETGTTPLPVVGMSGIKRTLADLGSGAGFPGVPIKLAFPEVHVTLIESQNKKSTFLKEVIRTLGLQGVEVYNGRAEHWGRQAEVVTLRAVEEFESTLSLAAELVAPGGRLCLLIGARQSGKAAQHLANFRWEVGEPIPESSGNLALVGNKP